MGGLATLAAETNPEGRTVVFVPARNEHESIAAVITGVKLKLPGAAVLVVGLRRGPPKRPFRLSAALN